MFLLTFGYSSFLRSLYSIISIQLIIRLLHTLGKILKYLINSSPRLRTRTEVLAAHTHCVFLSLVQRDLTIGQVRFIASDNNRGVGRQVHL